MSKTEHANFTGHDHAKFVRKGWEVTSTTCTKCRGAGLVLKAEGRQ